MKDPEFIPGPASTSPSSSPTASEIEGARRMFYLAPGADVPDRLLDIWRGSRSPDPEKFRRAYLDYYSMVGSPQRPPYDVEPGYVRQVR